MQRRDLLKWGGAALVAGLPMPSVAASSPLDPVQKWYALVLELVRHTATYSPPVAARAFAYLGIIAYESIDLAPAGAASLAGQLPGLAALPPRSAGMDAALVTHAALAAAVQRFFANTGPTGQRAIAAMNQHLTAQLSGGVEPGRAAASLACGQSVAAHILGWAATDGGALIDNMGFPRSYTLTKGPGHWLPTSLIVQHQAPLLPGWGAVRPFAKPAAGCAVPPPPAYSEDPASAFYAEAMEVVEVRTALSDEQKQIARFWSDDAMLSQTPPGHWVSIALATIRRERLGGVQAADVLARLGMAVADAFIACWRSKYQYDLLRPVSYIKKLIDNSWEPLLITPPFPEYPSGHSTQSAAAAGVLEQIFGNSYAFDDDAHVDEGMAPRRFASFAAAAEEAALSRLYGGIHFRAAIEQGQGQGRCVAAHVNALKTIG